MVVYPTEGEFELVRALVFDDESHYIFETYENYLPNEEFCTAFAQQLYDERSDKLKKLHSLNAYKWLESQISWKHVLKSVFKTDRLLTISKDEYISDLVKLLLDSYSPVTKEEYEKYIARNTKLQHEKIRVYKKYGKNLSIAVEKDFPRLSFKEVNRQQDRLERFRKKISLAHYYLMRDNFEVNVLMAFRDYFYSESYIEDYARTGPPEGDIEFYEETTEFIQNAYRGLKNLVSYLEKDHLISESLGVNPEELEENRALLNQLNKVEHKIKEDFNWANEELSLVDSKIPIIKRKDKTSKERILSSSLWSTLVGFTSSRPVMAIEYFLQFEGVVNTPERRTIERWLQHWDEVYRQ